MVGFKFWELRDLICDYGLYYQLIRHHYRGFHIIFTCETFPFPPQEIHCNDIGSATISHRLRKLEIFWYYFFIHHSLSTPTYMSQKCHTSNRESLLIEWLKNCGFATNFIYFVNFPVTPCRYFAEPGLTRHRECQCSFKWPRKLRIIQ